MNRGGLVVERQEPTGTLPSALLERELAKGAAAHSQVPKLTR